METTSSACALPAGWRASDILRAMHDDEENRRELRLAHSADGASANDHSRIDAASTEEGEQGHGR